MGQGLQDFYQQAQKRGFARDFQFRVIQIGGSKLKDEDFVLIKTATLPGRDMQIQQVPFMGVSFNIPGSPIFTGSDNWDVTFHATQDFLIRDEFEKLQSDIFDMQKVGTIGKGGVSNLSLPGVERTIQLDLIGDNLTTIRSYFLIGCFIRSVSEISYDLQGAGKPVDFKAGLSYQYWTTSPEGISTVNNK